MLKFPSLQQNILLGRFKFKLVTFDRKELAAGRQVSD